MCSKTTRSGLRNRSKRRKTTPKPLRKTRTKTKTRSLLKDFSPTPTTTGSPDSTRQTQITDHLTLEEKDDNNVAYLLDDTDTSATLNGLLWSSGSGSGSGGVVSSEEDSLCPSLTYAYHEDGRATATTTAAATNTSSSLLERSALRRAGKDERDVSEERWVCYEEVTSCVPEKNGLVLALKLDYDQIMNAWSDKGPLFVDDGARAVPDVLHDDDALQRDISNAFSGVGNVPLLRLPEDGSGVVDGEKTRALGPREAGVLRYKKKRQNRLFSKRIRYEVRKLNAEKRPRMKGRFVKRS